MAPRDKSEAFRRLAENRTNAALDAIRKLGNLSNRANYSYTPEQIDKIFSALRDAIDEAEKRFGETEQDQASRFTL